MARAICFKFENDKARFAAKCGVRQGDKWGRRSPRKMHRGAEPMPYCRCSCCCCPKSGAAGAGRDQPCTQIRQGSSGGASAG
jgi:hypothetical protein